MLRQKQFQIRPIAFLALEKMAKPGFRKAKAVERGRVIIAEATRPSSVERGSSFIICVCGRNRLPKGAEPKPSSVNCKVAPEGALN